MVIFHSYVSLPEGIHDYPGVPFHSATSRDRYRFIQVMKSTTSPSLDESLGIAAQRVTRCHGGTVKCTNHITQPKWVIIYTVHIYIYILYLYNIVITYDLQQILFK